MTPKQIAAHKLARTDVPPEFWGPEPNEDDSQELHCSNLTPCPCGGGKPRQIPSAGAPWDMHELECVSEHCNRKAEGATWLEVSDAWEQSIRTDQCGKHSYFRLHPWSDDWRCNFCGGVFRTIKGEFVPIP